MRTARQALATALLGTLATVAFGQGAVPEAPAQVPGHANDASGTSTSGQPATGAKKPKDVSKVTRAEKPAAAKELNRQSIDPHNPSGSVSGTARSPANAAQRSWGDPRGVLADDTRPKVANPRN